MTEGKEDEERQSQGPKILAANMWAIYNFDDPNDLIKLTRSRNGREFRRWFHSHCRGDTQSVAKAFVEVLQHVPRVRSLPSRVIGFVLTKAVGAIPGAGALLGLTASGVDSFFVERWLLNVGARSLLVWRKWSGD